MIYLHQNSGNIIVTIILESEDQDDFEEIEGLKSEFEALQELPIDYDFAVKVTDADISWPDDVRSIAYNAFNKPTTIAVYGNKKINPTDSQNTKGATLSFAYGADQSRYKQVKTVAGKVTTTLYLSGGYEIVTSDNKVEKKMPVAVAVADVGVKTETILIEH